MKNKNAKELRTLLLNHIALLRTGGQKPPPYIWTGYQRPEGFMPAKEIPHVSLETVIDTAQDIFPSAEVSSQLSQNQEQQVVTVSVRGNPAPRGVAVNTLTIHIAGSKDNPELSKVILEVAKVNNNYPQLSVVRKKYISYIVRSTVEGMLAIRDKLDGSEDFETLNLSRGILLENLKFSHVVHAMRKLFSTGVMVNHEMRGSFMEYTTPTLWEKVHHKSSGGSACAPWLLYCTSERETINIEVYDQTRGDSTWRELVIEFFVCPHTHMQTQQATVITLTLRNVRDQPQ